MTLLAIEQLTVTFGAVTAVDDLSLTIDAGTFVGLIGPNGAGKTTCIDALTGFVPARGHVLFDGRPIDGLSPDARVRLGMVRTWQSIELFDDLDVRENLEVAATRSRWWSPLLDVVWPSRRGAERAVDYAIDVLDLGHIVGRFPRQLSLGQRKLVGIARAIATEPRLLLLDEPAAGLDPNESSDLGNRLRGLLDHDITVLLVDHDMGLVLTVCDIVHVLEFGALISTGPPAAIRADERVISAYLGTEAR